MSALRGEQKASHHNGFQICEEVDLFFFSEKANCWHWWLQINIKQVRRKSWKIHKNYFICQLSWCSHPLTIDKRHTLLKFWHWEKSNALHNSCDLQHHLFSNWPKLFIGVKLSTLQLLYVTIQHKCLPGSEKFSDTMKYKIHTPRHCDCTIVTRLHTVHSV